MWCVCVCVRVSPIKPGPTHIPTGRTLTSQLSHLCRCRWFTRPMAAYKRWGNRTSADPGPAAPPTYAYRPTYACRSPAARPVGPSGRYLPRLSAWHRAVKFATFDFNNKRRIQNVRSLKQFPLLFSLPISQTCRLSSSLSYLPLPSPWHRCEAYSSL